jgi:hypothetical protein
MMMKFFEDSKETFSQKSFLSRPPQRAQHPHLHQKSKGI